jgi:homocysteine S-methyltransferase
MESDPIQSFLRSTGVVILDGGLATALEARGLELDDALWSAKMLIEDPEAIRRIHLDYLEAGADCISTASYQATIEGFKEKGFGDSESVDLLRRSVQLALSARDEFWARGDHRPDRRRPLVAASIGPYGAYLADGSEYTGEYDLGESELFEFHRRRWEILCATAPDLLACETIPSRHEARALIRLLEQTAAIPAWFSFTCRDGFHISDGTPIADAIAPLDNCDQVVAVGVNCVAARLIPGLIRQLRDASSKPIVVYPNSGEAYDATARCWRPGEEAIEIGQECVEWHRLGARLIGGCCRTGPEEIRKTSEALRTREGRA